LRSRTEPHRLLGRRLIPNMTGLDLHQFVSIGQGSTVLITAYPSDDIRSRALQLDHLLPAHAVRWRPPVYSGRAGSRKGKYRPPLACLRCTRAARHATARFRWPSAMQLNSHRYRRGREQKDQPIICWLIVVQPASATGRAAQNGRAGATAPARRCGRSGGGVRLNSPR
jgi:hypothetical protein